MKKKIGVFSFTCCEGCTVSFIETFNTKFEEYMKKMKIVNFRALKTDKKVKKMDIALVEGAISTESEIRKLQEIRKKTKILVALGSGAVDGYPSNQRNKFPEEKKREILPLIVRFRQIKEISPLNKFVKVDDNIPGCPVEEAFLIKKIDEYLT